jgi:hypothetical protein
MPCVVVEVMEGRSRTMPSATYQCGKDAAFQIILSQKSLGNGRMIQVKAE